MNNKVIKRISDFSNSGSNITTEDLSMPDKELKEKDYAKWWIKHNFKKWKDGNGDDLVFSDYAIFEKKTGLHPDEYFTKLTKKELIEIYNLPHIGLNFCPEEVDIEKEKVTEENCEFMKNTSAKELGEILASEGFSNEDLLKAREYIENKK